ncbi:MAG: O-antigen ligase family protein [Limnohabitans sp.]|nr:O-antigen ligase family protein [Limnohabitans sp.]
MQKKYLTYIGLVLIHVVLGFLIFLNSKISIPYQYAILSLGLLILLYSQDKENQVLYICGYVVGSEVLLRMTGGALGYEIAKYSITIFMLIGIYFSGFSKNSIPYWIFLFLLLPGVIYATEVLNLESSIRKSLGFNISGPICLGVSSVYCYQRKISLKQIENILLSILLPIITTVTYMFFYTPNIRTVVTDTNSNFETSGGFGPNQVSTILGLGLFLIFIRVIFYSKSKKIMILNVVLLMFIAFRGIVTFSRGGMICSVIMIVLLLIVLFRVTKSSAKVKIIWTIIGSFIAFVLIWGYSSFQTNGLIDKRYSNQDAAGRIKQSRLSGREEIMENEIKIFLENPLFGVGVGKAKEDRVNDLGTSIASHSEITRTLAEHGTLGVASLLILLITPLALYINNRYHIYLLSFYVFWLLTINHAAMRLAAPAFVYALTLLYVYGVEKPKEIVNNNNAA